MKIQSSLESSQTAALRCALFIVLALCFIVSSNSVANAQTTWDFVPSTTNIHNLNSGNVGIATTTTPSRLSLASGTSDTEGIAFGSDLKLYRATSGGTNVMLQTNHWIVANDGAWLGPTAIATVLYGNVTAGQNLFLESTSDPTKGLVYIASTGGRAVVGAPDVGTTERLVVNGDVKVTGNIAAKYQDIAEWVSVSRPLLPGTVVILDPDHANAVMPSLTAYDTRVAGVVSANPGIVLGEATEGKDKIATTGRVKVRVDATGSPIHVGDLLVSSEKEGVAMRSAPIDVGGVKIHRPGTLIGKALEPLETGEGEVLVLLSLQ